MFFPMLYPLIAALLVVADQLLKIWVRSNIPLGTSIPFLPHLMELTHVQNTGAAFSLFSNHTWLLTIVSAVSALLFAFLLFRRILPKAMGMTALTLILAGAVGNLIDRVLYGYVVDMFQFTFVHFAIFNIADICVTLGGILFCAHILFDKGSRL
ncbi:MAG: signal peptidase II [Evtepia sp.]